MPPYLVGGDAASVNEAGLDVFALEAGIGSKHVFGGVTRREHSEHVHDGQTAAAIDRFAPENLRVHSDALQYFLFIHKSPTAKVFYIADSNIRRAS